MDMNWTDTRPTLHFAIAGTGPRSLICIHELGGSLESFDDVAAELEDDFRVLRYDQRGAGLSEKERAPFTIEDHANDLARVIAAANLPAPYCIVGLAAGAAIALSFAATHRKDITALALCCPATSVDAERRQYLEKRSTLAAQQGMRAIADASLERSYPEKFRAADADSFEAYCDMFLANDPECYGHANMALADATLDVGACAGDLPCLVLAGEHDALRPPPEVAVVASKIRRAEYAVIDSGHLMPVQAPETMAERLRAFFTRVG